MPKLALLPGPVDAAAPDGVIVPGEDAQALLDKLAARMTHYEDLHLAYGDGWLAVFSTSASTSATESAALPWAGASALYLRRLADGCYCQMGYRPNVPEGLTRGLGAHLGQAHGVQTPVALLAGETGERLVELAPSRRVADIDLAKVAPA